MKVTAILGIVLAVILAFTTWHFYNEAMDAQQEKSALEVVATKLTQDKAMLERRLEEQVASISKEKEQEIDRLRATYDTLVTDLKAEIDSGQITITKLADRLSVSMVDKILFPSGEAQITSAGVKVLQRVGNVLKNAEKKVIRVEGHTDNVPMSSALAGKFPTNWELSTARATNVVRFLQEKVGVEPERLEAVGMSEYHPVASNAKPVGRSQNRRIEIALLPNLAAVAAEVHSEASPPAK